jgi:hypothetical protein
VVAATNWNAVDEMTGMQLPHYVLRVDDEEGDRTFEVPCEDVHDEQAEGWAVADDGTGGTTEGTEELDAEEPGEADDADGSGEEEADDAEEAEEEEEEEEELFEDETRARRKLAAKHVVLALGTLLRPRCRRYVLSIEGEEERDILLDDLDSDDGESPEQRVGGVDGEGAGFREGEWMDIKVICTARVPIVNIVRCPYVLYSPL